jgi:hypothetical protein
MGHKCTDGERTGRDEDANKPDNRFLQYVKNSPAGIFILSIDLRRLLFSFSGSGSGGIPYGVNPISSGLSLIIKTPLIITGKVTFIAASTSQVDRQPMAEIS